MHPSDKAALWTLVGDVMAYYRQSASEFTLGVWWQACQPFELEQVRKAMTTHCMDPDRGQYAPKVADLVRILAGTTTDRSALAWGKVMQEISATGSYQDVDFGDPATHAAIHDLGGWPKVCRTQLKELGHLQHRFCETYRAYASRGVEQCPLVLMGDRSPDAEYQRKGLPLPKAKLAGARKCAEVMAGRQALQGAAAPQALLQAVRDAKEAA